MRKTHKLTLSMKMEIDLASLHEFSTNLDVEKSKNVPPPLSKKAWCRTGGFRKASLGLIKSAAGQAKRFGRWLQRMLECLRRMIFFLLDLLIAVGLRLCLVSLLGWSFLAMLNGWSYSSLPLFACTLAFVKEVRANCPPKYKNDEER